MKTLISHSHIFVVGLLFLTGCVASRFDPKQEFKDDPVVLQKQLLREPRPEQRILFRNGRHDEVTVSVVQYQYELPGTDGRMKDVFVAAFLDEPSGFLWVGLDYQTYLVLPDSGIIGFSLGPVMLWNRSLFDRSTIPLSAEVEMKDASEILSALDRFLTSEVLAGLYDQQRVGLERYFGYNFIAERPRSSGVGIPNLEGIEFEDGEVEIQVSSQRRDFFGQLYFDAKTFELKRALLDGKEMSDDNSSVFFSPWKPIVADVYPLAGGGPKSVSAVRRILTDPEGEVMAVTFALPDSGIVWAGPEMDFYIDFGDKVTGVQVSDRGWLLWCDSQLPARTLSHQTWDSLEEVADNLLVPELLIGDKWRFRGDSPEDELAYAARTKTDLSEVFGGDVSFFNDGRYDLKVQKIDLEEGVLRIDLANITVGRAGTVWVDVSTRQVIEAVEAGSDLP